MDKQKKINKGKTNKCMEKQLKCQKIINK